MRKIAIVIILIALTFLSCQIGGLGKVEKETRLLREPPLDKPWTKQSTHLWLHPLPLLKTDANIPIPKEDLTKENIGKKERVKKLFDKWILKEEILNWRNPAYADITTECKGMVDIEFAPTPEEYTKPENQLKYFAAVDKLIDVVSDKLVSDFGDALQGKEKDMFTWALKTLAWQESTWQHYFRYKNWFFVLLNASSMNKLNVWGITQVARSAFSPKELLNKNFFDSKGYCSIFSSLYYGFLEFYFCYLHARQNLCNRNSLMNKILGAYNRYSSGFSSCFPVLSKSSEYYRNFQISALGGFLDNFVNKPWEKHIAELENELKKVKK